MKKELTKFVNIYQAKIEKLFNELHCKYQSGDFGAGYDAYHERFIEHALRHLTAVKWLLETSKPLNERNP